MVIVIGADTHKATHTLAAVQDPSGRLAGRLTAAARKSGFIQMLDWARGLGAGRVWALEDCRHVSGPFERVLVAAGERVVRVPPGLSARGRGKERARGKSDPIDARAIARAALREGIETLPAAHLDAASLEISAEQGARVRVARDLVRDIRGRTRRVAELEREIGALVGEKAPELLDLAGCGPLTAAKVIAETAGVERFDSDANQGRLHEPARVFLARKEAEGKSRREALRCLKRHLARAVWRALREAQRWESADALPTSSAAVLPTKPEPVSEAALT